MKIIDILNKIANGEEPLKKIVWRNKVYIYDEDDYYTEDNVDAIFDYHEITDILNDEVEILETTITYKPDKIEKIDMFDYFTGYWYEELPEDFKRHLETNFETLNSKINEIIDHINKEV